MAAFVGYSESVPTGATAVPLFCEHCKARIGILMPADLRSLAAIARAFEDAHAECTSDHKCKKEDE